MDNKSDEQFIIMKVTIEANKQDIKDNKQDSDEKMMKLTEDFKQIIASTIPILASPEGFTKASGPYRPG